MKINNHYSKLTGLVLLLSVLSTSFAAESKKDWPSPIEDSLNYSFLLFDQLEYQNNDNSPDTFSWDVLGWYGGDYNRLWFKTEGSDQTEGENTGEGEVQLLYGRLISPFWDFQAGVRYERLYGGAGPDLSRSFAVIGLQGMAPYLFEVDSALFLSEDGDTSARITAEYSILFSQRLILVPSIEVNLAAQDVLNFGVGKGLNNIELGLRLRYEIKREFAPYIGINWSKLYGNTADFARNEGEAVDDLSVVGGIRLWF